MFEENRGGAPIEHILICGGGLAAHMAAAALSHQLPPSIRITVATLEDMSGTDLFYGSVTAPTAYGFNLSAGLFEPDLVMDNDAAFSWGTKYDHWASGSRSWIQCFHLPFPVIDGVLFHDYLAQQGIDQLERFLVTAVAARKGVFAHPLRKPEQAQHPLSRAEYGYQFSPQSYARLFQNCTNQERVRQVRGALSKVDCDEGGIVAVRLSDGQSLTADLYVDCTGPKASLLSCLGTEFSGTRRLRAAMSGAAAAQLGPPLRTVAPRDYGWQSDTPLRDRIERLTIYDPETESDALTGHGADPQWTAEAVLGRRSVAWSGNCVALGQAACVVEPLTPAPMMLLEADIGRLLSLIPLSSDTTVEQREFNRRFAEDYEHAELFARALFETDNLPETPYWRAARAVAASEKLARKIALFEDRGLLVAYDLEPFHREDWTILHYGMGRVPARYDRAADRAPAARVQQFLSKMKQDIDQLTETLPRHAAYMAELRQYLLRNRR